MTRVLQIRRGTSAAHENFVGLPGEITMDTDNKTIRLHDGETLGGTVIGGNSGEKSEFDIETVPSEFWQETIAQYAPAPFKVIETAPIAFRNNSAGIEYLIGGNDKPKFIQTVLVCQNDEAGYTAGDEVWCWGIGNRNNPSPTPTHENTGLNIVLAIDFGTFWVNHRVTSAKTNINDENWRILYRVYC
ncbi:MAG: hypothetical protein R8M71_03430 [Alphaproteobacteria bacterium]|nr:hypothetical protein [Alphaproteobacteria bacterium]